MRGAFVVNVFWKFVKDLEYLWVTLDLDVYDVELVGVTYVLAEIGHFIYDDLLIAVEGFDDWIIIFIHYMNINILLQILSLRRHCLMLRSFLMKHRYRLLLLMSMHIAPAAQQLLVLVLSLEG